MTKTLWFPPLTATLDRPIDEAMRAADFWTGRNSCETAVTADLFPPRGRGEVQVELGLVHPDREFSSDAEATRMLASLGLVREDRLRVVLAFLEVNSDAARERTVATAASRLTSDGRSVVVYVGGYGKSLCLRTHWADAYGWASFHQYLVRRK